MAKVSVRQCDKCDVLDSHANRIKRVTIVAVRIDLCANCRVIIIDQVIDDAVRAVEAVAAQDGQMMGNPGQQELFEDGGSSADVADDGLKSELATASLSPGR